MATTLAAVLACHLGLRLRHRIVDAEASLLRGVATTLAAVLALQLRLGLGHWVVNAKASLLWGVAATLAAVFAFHLRLRFWSWCQRQDLLGSCTASPSLDSNLIS